MGVRNCADIGENLKKIMSRLMANQELVKLLYFTEKDAREQDFTSEIAQYGSYEKFCQEKIFEKLIKIVPRVGPKETANSVITIQVVNGLTNPGNSEFKNLRLNIEVFVPLTQWLLKGENLRPFYILGEIQKSLNGKTINGLGKLQGGDFEINFLTDEISCYEQVFSLTSYE